MCRLQHWIVWSVLGSLASVGLTPLDTGAKPREKEVPPKVQALIKQLGSKDENDRLNAIMALHDLGREARAATAALIEVVKTGDEYLRLNSSLALGRIGKEAVGPVARLVDDKDPRVRFCAVWTLGLLGPEAQSTTDAVVAALKDKDDGVRRKAAFALKRIGPQPEVAAPALIKVLADPSPDVREETVAAIKAMGAKAVPFLAQAIRESAKLRAHALGALNQISAGPDVLVAEFAPMLREKELELQKIAGDVLIRQGKASIPQLMVMLKDMDQRVRLEGLRLLAIIPADSALMLPELKLLAADKASPHRESALVLLARLGRDGVPHLIVALNDPDAGVRWTAAYSLGEMGRAAASAIAALKHAAEDGDPEVRGAAKEAIRKIDGER